jgi:hypothetical protein
MAESATLNAQGAQTGSDAAASWPLGEILRDIARGGLAGLAVGVVVGGLGGRVAMRLIALIVPESAGRFTENGNRIGDITLGGTFALVLFGGLFAGVFLATIWIVVSPWLPRSLGLRVLAAIPLAIGLGAFGVIEGSNPDFIVLGFEPGVIVVLLALVGAVGASMALVDAWLDRRLPRPRSSMGQASGAYIAISAIGTFFAAGVVATFLDERLRPVGIALVVSGLATLCWWYLRYRGAERPPLTLCLLGSGGVVAAVVLGFAVLLPDIRRALGIF